MERERESSYGNYTRILRVVLNKSRLRQPTKLHFYCHKTSILQTNQEKRGIQAETCLKSKDEHIRNVLFYGIQQMDARDLMNKNETPYHKL